jgi:hypothetical protein
MSITRRPGKWYPNLRRNPLTNSSLFVAHFKTILLKDAIALQKAARVVPS